MQLLCGMSDQNNPDRPRVTGLGGIFFKSPDVQATKAWYTQHLGIKTDDYGATFEWLQKSKPDTPGLTVWSPFKADTKYFGPGDQTFMVNYRVNDLPGLLAELKKEGIEPLEPMQEYDYGKFAHIVDPNGNKIELWEPVDSGFGSMEGKTTF